MSKSKETEWTVLFDFPSSAGELYGYYPTSNGQYLEFNNQAPSLENCMTWNDIESAKDFAKEKCGKYGWRLFPTKIEIIEFDEEYKEGYTFTEDDFYR